jgi:PAS domain S-box-containing protein
MSDQHEKLPVTPPDMSAEENLRRNHEIFYNLVQNAPFGIFIVDADFRLISLSAGAEKAFSHVHPLIGRDFGEIMQQLWNEPFAHEVTEQFRYTLATGESYETKETTEQRSDISDVESYDWKIERVTLPDGRYGIVCYFYDLTELRAVEKSLRESEEKLRLFIEHAPVAVAMLDSDLRYLAVSRRWQLDYRLENEIIGRSHYKIFPDLPEKWREIYEKCLAGTTEKSDGECIIRADGTMLWLKWEIRPWYNIKGEIGGIVIFTEDVTEQKFADEQLRLYEKVVVNTRDAVLITEAAPIDPPGPRIVYVNPAFTEMTGYTAQEIVGQTPRILQGAKTDRARLDKVRRALKKWNPTNVNLTNYRKDGSEFEVDLDIVPVADQKGEFTHFVSVQRDITERKQAEQLILEKNQMLEQTYDAIFMWNLKSGISYWNANAEKLYGYTEQDVVGKVSHQLLKTVFPKPFADFIADLRGKGFWEGELIHTTKAGNGVIVEDRMHVIKKTADNMVVLETLRDVTERRQLETKLARAAQLSLVGELAAGLAHEIKNPLAGIKGVIDIMLQRRTGIENDDEGEILESVRHEIERIDKTVRVLLQHSRLRPIKIRHASISETVRRAARFALLQTKMSDSEQNPAKQIRIELELPPEELFISHDVTGIEDAVLNLILNARQAVGNRKNGIVTVRLARTKNQEKAQSESVIIQVSDNGVGIDSENIERIFNAFFTTREDGTGLGLTAVKRIARAHGGDCEVVSNSGKGATFTISFPVFKEQ